LGRWDYFDSLNGSGARQIAQQTHEPLYFPRSGKNVPGLRNTGSTKGGSCLALSFARETDPPVRNHDLFFRACCLFALKRSLLSRWEWLIPARQSGRRLCISLLQSW
jgi:hypothetical protein